MVGIAAENIHFKEDSIFGCRIEIFHLKLPMVLLLLKCFESGIAPVSENDRGRSEGDREGAQEPKGACAGSFYVHECM